MDAIEQVLASPRSIAARRELAAAWRESGDERYGLLERQLLLHDGPAPERHIPLEHEVMSLIEQHGARWAGRVPDFVDGYLFELGVVSAVVLTGSVFIEHAKLLVSIAPLLHLRLREEFDPEQLARTPQLAQISSLIIDGGAWFDDAAARTLAASPYLTGLRILNLRDSAIRNAGEAALSGSRSLTNMVYIDLSGSPCASTGGGHRVENGDYFVIGARGEPMLRKAYEDAQMTYTNGLDNWPPGREELAYDE